MSNRSTSRKVATIVRQVNATKERIGKDRDKLRELLDELEAIVSDADEATEHLEAAVDMLSRYL